MVQLDQAKPAVKIEVKNFAVWNDHILQKIFGAYLAHQQKAGCASRNPLTVNQQK
jgi:hypothetical protein